MSPVISKRGVRSNQFYLTISYNKIKELQAVDDKYSHSRAATTCLYYFGSMLTLHVMPVVNINASATLLVLWMLVLGPGRIVGAGGRSNSQ